MTTEAEIRESVGQVCLGKTAKLRNRILAAGLPI